MKELYVAKSIANRFTTDSTLRKDLTQEAFIGLWLNGNYRRGVGRCQDYLDKHHNGIGGRSYKILPFSLDEHPKLDKRVTYQNLHKLDLEVLTSTLNSTEVFILSLLFDGYNHTEIAYILDVQRNTVTTYYIPKIKRKINKVKKQVEYA